MAIKMTHRGTLPAEVLYTGTCTRCYSQYEAYLGDLTVKEEADFNLEYYVADCQLCGKEVYFTRKRNVLHTTVPIPKSPPPPPMRRGDGKLVDVYTGLVVE